MVIKQAHITKREANKFVNKLTEPEKEQASRQVEGEGENYPLYPCAIFWHFSPHEEKTKNRKQKTKNQMKLK